jgi:hypothetical protein
MKTHVLLFAALLAAVPTLLAQDAKDVAAQGMPNPRTKEHDALKMFVGNWDCEMKMAAMPGVPGMEQPTESRGLDRAELVCNGLYLKSTFRGTYQDQPFEGLFLAGYDPFKKVYTGIWIDSQADAATTFEGRFDANAKTWHWSGRTPHGEVRSVFVIKDADTTVETCFMKDADGKEVQCSEITRRRSRTAPVADAAARGSKTLAKEHAILHKDIGEWDATVKTIIAADVPPSEEKATERIDAICNGKWLWTDFRGQMMGQPFEGHAIVGYNPTDKEYVTFWIDSTSAVPSRTTGTADDSGKVITMTGSGIDHEGKPVEIHEVLTWKDDNTRVLKMEFKGEAHTHRMEITCKRKTAR